MDQIDRIVKEATWIRHGGRKRLQLLDNSHYGGEGGKEDGEDVHLIDDPMARLGLKLGAPVASGGGSRVRVDAAGGSDGGRVGALRGAPVGGAVHGFPP